MIICDYDLCVFNDKKRCLLRKVYISAASSCDTCIIPPFPEELKESYKNELLEKFNIKLQKRIKKPDFKL